MATVPASLRYNNPGAMYPGPSARRFGSTGTEIIGGGHKIATFSDPVQGAAAQFDLLRRSYTGMPLFDAINKWSGGNSAGTYVQGIARDTGLSPSTVLTPELLASPQGVALARRMAQHEAGRPFPLSDAQWSEAQRRGLGGPPAAQETAKPGSTEFWNQTRAPQGAPITTGSTDMAPMQPKSGGWNLYDAMTNPLTMAGLSILGDPERNVPRGFATGANLGGQMQEQRRQQVAQQAYSDMMGQQNSPYAPMLAQMSPEKGVPLLLDLMEQQRRREDDAAKWEVEKRQKEALTKKYEKEAADAGSTFGKTGSVFQDPKTGDFFSVQFGSDGSKKVEPLQANGAKLNPSRGVAVSGDKMYDRATGRAVADMSQALAGGEKAKATGRIEGEAQAKWPKAQMAFSAFEIKSNNLEATIDRALGNVNVWTTGPGGLLANVPGTAAKALKGDLDTIRANVGFEELQTMRESSPTGGALGSVSERENTLLQSVKASIDQLQDGRDVTRNLNVIKSNVRELRAIQRQKFEQDAQKFGGAAKPQSPSAGEYVWNPATGKVEPKQ